MSSPSSPPLLDPSQTYEEENVDDYITGVEQVGADPTAAAATVAPVDTNDNVDAGTNNYEFREYDLIDGEETQETPYDYGDYGDYGAPTDTKKSNGEEEFAGVAAETDFRESGVSDDNEVC